MTKIMSKKQLLPKINDPVKMLQIEGKKLRGMTAKQLRKEFKRELLKRI